MKRSKTERGFDIIKFYDIYERECVIQKSSSATQNCIWIGRRHFAMHLNKAKVAEIIPILQKFVETGEL